MRALFSAGWLAVLLAGTAAADDAVRVLSNPNLREAPRVWSPAPPKQDSVPGRIAAGLASWWVTPAADRAGRSMSSAARLLADPQSQARPDIWLPDRPTNPAAARTIDFIGATIVDPLAKHAFDTAMRVGRSLGTMEGYATEVLMPDLTWDWADSLMSAGSDARPGRSLEMDSRVRERFPKPPQEKRKDSLGLIKAPKGALPSAPSSPKRLQTGGSMGVTPGTFQPMGRESGN
ncbi:MAG: hypothetical protein WC943_13590 [Elusimicrobiota bacterium]